MAVALSPKPSGGIQLYSWKPDLIEGDGIAGYSLTPTGVTIEAEQQAADEIQFFVAGGTTGQVHSIAASVDTSFGEALKETLYIPIMGPGNSFSYTAQNVIDFALRPIVGLNGTPTTSERADALEWLNDWLATMAGQGADFGVAVPLALADTIYTSDEFVQAMKNNLRVMVAEQYGRQVAPTTAMMAFRGLQQIKQRLLPDDRGGVDYF
jgi:hypothetical protein